MLETHKIRQRLNQLNRYALTIKNQISANQVVTQHHNNNLSQQYTQPLAAHLQSNNESHHQVHRHISHLHQNNHNYITKSANKPQAQIHESSQSNNNSQSSSIVCHQQSHFKGLQNTYKQNSTSVKQQQYKTLNKKNQQLKKHAAILEQRLSNKMKVYNSTLLKSNYSVDCWLANNSKNRVAVPGLIKIFMTRLQFDQSLQRIYESMLDQNMQQFNQYYIYIKACTQNRIADAVAMNQLILIDTENLNICSQPISLISYSSILKYKKMLKFTGIRQANTGNNKNKQQNIHYYIYYDGISTNNIDQWYYFLSEAVKILEISKTNVPLQNKWKQTKVDTKQQTLNNIALSRIKQNDRLTLSSFDGLLQRKKQKLFPVQRQNPQTQLKLKKLTRNSLQMNDFGYFKQIGIRKQSADQPLVNMNRSSGNYAINSQFGQFDISNHEKSPQPIVPIVTVVPIQLISSLLQTEQQKQVQKLQQTIICNKKSIRESTHDNQYQIKQTPKKKQAIYWMQDNHMKSSQHYIEMNEDTTNRQKSQVESSTINLAHHHKQALRPPKLNIHFRERHNGKLKGKSFTQKTLNNSFGPNQKTPRKNTYNQLSLNQLQDNANIEQHIDKQTPKNTPKIRERMNLKIGNINEKSISSFGNSEIVSSSPSKLKKSELKKIAKKQSELMRKDHHRKSFSRQIDEEQEVQYDKKMIPHRSSFKSHSRKKKSQTSSIGENSNNTHITAKGVVHQQFNENYQQISDDDSQVLSSTSSSDQEEQWKINLEELKNGIVLWKYAYSGWAPHQKKLFISRNQLQLCYCDIKNNLDEKKVFMRDIIELKYRKFGKGITKHKGANIQRDRCFCVTFAIDGKQKSWQFMISQTEPEFNLAEFTRKLTKLWYASIQQVQN